MRLHSKKTTEVHLALLERYKERLGEIEDFDGEEEEKETPFERSYLHNAIHLHELWFEQLEDTKERTDSHLLREILQRRESDLGTFQRWLNNFAKDARPFGWVIWGWSYPLQTFVGFPIKSHDNSVPLGVDPILVLDCWEHSYMQDYGLEFADYLDKFWADLNWDVIERRHRALASKLGFNLK